MEEKKFHNSKNNSKEQDALISKNAPAEEQDALISKNAPAEEQDALISKNIYRTSSNSAVKERKFHNFKNKKFSSIAWIMAILVIVIAVILFSKPWNYLIAIVLFLAFGLYIWNRMKVGKKQVKTEPEIILEEITQEEEKVPIEKLRWEKSHITAELKEKRIQYDNLGEQLAELDEVNERSREYEMKRQAVQMAADHLEQLSEEMRGYLKRDLNEKASSFICEITGGKYKKLVTDEKLHVSLMTDEKRVEIEQVSRGTVEQVYLALRMAVGELLCEEEMPVILDDAFAYYDEERMLQTLRWLKEHKKQVIIFTCQTREEQVMKEAGLVYHKIEL